MYVSRVVIMMLSLSIGTHFTLLYIHLGGIS